MGTFARYVAVVVASLLALSPLAGQAQPVQVQVEEQPDGTALVAITAEWEGTLAAAADSVGHRRLDAGLVRAVAEGWLHAYQALPQPRLALPTVQVVASDYDELSLLEADTAAARLVRGPLVEALGLGVERRRPAVTLQARLVDYDADRQVLRRYRRLVVAVRPGAEPPGARSMRRSALRVSQDDNPHLDVTRSVLADGQVYKLPIRTEGVYRIDRSLLASLPGAPSPDGIDPNTVQVFTNGGAPLPALNRAPRPADLIETPVRVVGGGDGSFGSDDAVLFYANGPTGWTYDAETQAWNHYVHPFDTENYVFIKLSGSAARQAEALPFPGFGDATVLDQVEGRYVRDFDEAMWSREAGTGHTWVSNLLLAGSTRDVLDNVRLPGFEGGTIRYQARPAVGATLQTELYFNAGGQRLETVRLSNIGTREDSPIARSTVVDFEQTLSSGQPVTLTMELERQQNDPRAAIDWVRAFYPQQLQPVDGVTRFATPGGTAGRFEFVLSGFGQAPEVWDVTEPGTVRRLAVQPAGGNYRVQLAVEDAAAPRELIAFAPQAVRSMTPEALCGADVEAEDCFMAVANQNLHGIAGFPAFVIVTPEAFQAEAERLAERRRRDGLSVVVTRVDQIYNEFSGGQVDPRAIRDYFRFLYDRGPGEDPALRYALLFGDGHFDYRNLQPDVELTNWIPPFETEETFDPIRSYTSDDYFGLLDPDEGLWPWPGNSGISDERVDLGIGRFTVQNASQARTVIDKIERYESPATYGPWRTRYVFVADDGFNDQAGNLEFSPDLHTENIEVVAEALEDVDPALNQQKIYGVSYNRVFRTGWKIPEAEEDLLEAIRNGALVINYSGHGGEFGLAQEEIFTDEDALALSNGDRLPIFVTATCSFGRWDLASAQTGAELLLENPDGGAIALLTTVRTVYTRGQSGNQETLNAGLNKRLNIILFTPGEDGLPLRLGDALRLTKNTSVGAEGNNRKFNLLGDPTMRLGLPTRQAALTQINGTPADGQPAQIRALDTITLQGQVRTPDGTVDAGFTGPVTVSVFDAARRVAIDEDYVRLLAGRPYYRVQEDLIWRGTVNAQSGQFEARFVVPKDISYSDEPGRISLYAAGSDVHAGGFTENVIVGGTADNPPDDSQGPEIEVFVDGEAFVSGGLTSPTPQLLVRFFDQSGLNTVGAGVGHEMLLIVDGDEQNAVEIGELYESEENSFQRGTVTYTFDEPLAPGPHTFTVRAWDVLNNSGTASVDALVSADTDLALANVYNYPNPTTGPTRFIFEHNQPLGTPATVRVRIYSLSGQPVATFEEQRVLGGGPEQVVWDGVDDDFDRLAPGIYLYKVRVEVEDAAGERQVTEQLEKLAIVR